MFDPNDPKLVKAISDAIESAVKSLNLDIRCLDWFSYNPDYHISLKKTGGL